MSDVEYRECVITHLDLRGKGVSGSPLRRVTQVWVRNSDGTCSLIAEHDPMTPEFNRATGKFEERQDG